MPTKPRDNKLGKRDTITLSAYRNRIDPEGHGVKRAIEHLCERPRHCAVCQGRASWNGRLFVRMLSQFTRSAQGSMYASLRSDLERMRELVSVYGPELVERAVPWDDAAPAPRDDVEACLVRAVCREDDGTD